MGFVQVENTVHGPWFSTTNTTQYINFYYRGIPSQISFISELLNCFGVTFS